ncbi:MAG: DUF1926 domain-containing protein [Planctomycetales bacterium]|nr:DUF1926 domain-containing protein [Planctomycetales bacterium]
MPDRLLFVMLLHDHQPVGNFDKVMVEACEKAYEPALELLSEFETIRFGLHVSGPLLRWVESSRPRLAALIREAADSGRAELVGGGLGEPILPLIPERDRRGQVQAFRRHLETRYGVRVRGAWLTERVWEPALARTLAEAGVEWTAVDDHHLARAGVPAEDVLGSYVTEDDGRTVRVFAGSERLRYLIPFRGVEEVLAHLREMRRRGARAVCYADDGEKFGLWPGTWDHVHRAGWLGQFLTALEASEDWLECVTPSEAVDRLPPAGKVYLPTASYPEMEEWALPPPAQRRRARVAGSLGKAGLAEAAKPFLAGAEWRSFQARYVEVETLVSRMRAASARVAALPPGHPAGDEARRQLYLGQCNCAYWHGIFGGTYLPHLREAVVRCLMAADRTAADALGEPPLTVVRGDWNADGRPEVVLRTPALATVVVPHRGGHLATLDARRRDVDFLIALARRREAYHAEDGESAPRPAADPGAVESIHDIAQSPVGAGLALAFDAHAREGLVDRLLPPAVTPADLAGRFPPDEADLPTGEYAAESGEGPEEARVLLSRETGWRRGGSSRPVRVEKEIRLRAGAASFTVHYRVTGRGPGSDAALLGVEWNVQLLAPHAPDRYVRGADGRRVGDLASPAHLRGVPGVDLVDETRGVALRLRADRAVDVLCYPVETVSRSEAGAERVFQGTAVVLAVPVTLGEGRVEAFAITAEVGGP